MRSLKRGSMAVLMGILIFLVVVWSAAGATGEDGKKLNLNTATEQELRAVPGISAGMAKKIVRYREENGGFVDLEELLDIDGFNGEMLRKIKKHVKIEEAEGCNC